MQNVMWIYNKEQSSIEIEMGRGSVEWKEERLEECSMSQATWIVNDIDL